MMVDGVKKVVLSARVNATLRDAVDKIAAQNGLTRNDQVIAFLMRCIRDMNTGIDHTTTETVAAEIPVYDASAQRSESPWWKR